MGQDWAKFLSNPKLGQSYPYISKWAFLGQMDNRQKGFILYVFANFLIRMVRIVVKRRELIICGA